MAKILRVKMRWSGFIGGPGYSIFHFRDFTAGDPTVTDAQGAVDKTDTFAEALKGLIPYQSALTVESDVEVLEETTGEMQDILSTTPDPSHNATISLGPTFAGPVGAVVNWRTNGVRNGRRIHGRTFLVPLLSQCFDVNGTLSSGSHTTLLAAANAFRDTAGAPDLGVWARPTPIKDENGNPTGEYNPDGEWWVTSACNVPDMGAVLRSRRD